MSLSDVRARIDEIDARILDLFSERMEIAREVAESKALTGKAVFDPAREREKLLAAGERVPEAYRPQAHSLMSLLMSMNKAEQLRILSARAGSSRSAAALASLKPADEPFPATATVACQGVEGAYSQLAACKLFRVPAITYLDSFEGVCRAVESGMCEFGVLPIENSTAGSVNAVYDLLAEYRFSIVRSVRLKVDHNLLALPGATVGSIREVWSHEQAIAQCADYLDRLGCKVHVCGNTAQAAERVARSGRTDVAALSSRSCAELYGLDVIDEDVQDEASNYTRFVCIASKPAIYAGATRTSLMLTLPHQPGSLYRVLERLYALDVNLVKLESRPIPGHDFEFMFYFDLDCPVGSQAFASLLDALDDICERSWYFGSYSEVL